MKAPARMLRSLALLTAFFCATQAHSTITEFPHLETFEHGGALPVGWISDPAAGDESWACVTSSTHGPGGDHTTGSGYFVRVRNRWRTTDTSWLYLPPLDLSGLSNPAISFWYCIGDTAASSTEAFLYLEALQDADWVQIGTVKRWSPFFWRESLDSLAAHKSANTLLRFRVSTENLSEAATVCIDDVLIFDNVGVPDAPARLSPAHAATGVPVFATLRWEARAGLSGYRLHVGTDGGGVTTPSNLLDGLVLPGESERYGLSDLLPATEYYWHLVAFNAVGDGPASPIQRFTTGARTTISTFPYTQNFNNAGNTPAGWINGFDDNGTGWHFTDFHPDHTTGSGYYADVNVKYHKPVTPITSSLLSPRFDLSDAAYPKLSYWHRKDNSGNALDVHVYYAGAWHTPHLIQHTASTAWTNTVIDLTPFKADDLRIRFDAVEQGWWDGQIVIGLDDVALYDDTEIPLATTVVAPTDGASPVFTRGVFQWEPVAGADDYLFCLGTDGSGSDLPSNLIDRLPLGNVTSRPFSGLDYHTTYRWAVIPKNQIGEAIDIPVWTFTTLPEPAGLPFIDGFENDLSAWQVEVSPNGTLTLSDEDVAEGSFALRATADADMFNAAFSSITRIFAPAVNPQLAFWYRITPGDYAAISVDIFDGVWHNNIWTGEADEWTEAILDLAPYNTEDGEFVLRIVLEPVYTTFGGTVSQIVYLDGLRLLESGGPPLPPHSPDPAATATGVSVTTALQWSPGMFSSHFHVYGSTDAMAVSNLNASAHWVGPTPDRIVWPPMLAGGADYFWRVVASNAFGVTTGDVWRFTTAATAFFPLPHVQTFGAGIPAEYETLVNTWSGLRVDPGRNSTLAPPNDGVLVMEGGGSSVTYWYPGNMDLFWDYAAEDGLNWRNTARMTIYLESPGGNCQLFFDYRVLNYTNVREINLRVDKHAGNGWQQVGPTFHPDGANSDWTRVSLDLGAIPPGPFALRFWSSIKHNEAQYDQGLLLDNLLVQALDEGPVAPYGPVPYSGETAAPVDLPLTWNNGANTHSIDLYLSTDPDAVAFLNPDALVIGGVLTDRYDPPATLAYSTDYSWRVVAHAINGVATTGTVWTFTTQPDPVKTLPYATGFDVDPWNDGWSRGGDAGELWDRRDTEEAGGSMPEMYCEYGHGMGVARLVSPALRTEGVSVLNLTFKHKYEFYTLGVGPLSLHVQTSPDGVNWTDEYVRDALADIGPETLDLQIATQAGGITYLGFAIAGELHDFDAWYIDDVAVSVSMHHPPHPAWSPQPTNGVLTVPTDAQLAWSNGVRTATVDLYLDTDPAAVEALAPAARRLNDQAADSFDPGMLTPGTHYAWRVVSRDADGQTTAGPVWTFRTRSALPLSPSFHATFLANPWHEGWTQQNKGCDELWGLNTLPPARAGGTLPELVCASDGSPAAVTRLVSPPIDTRDLDGPLCVRFLGVLSYGFTSPEGLELAIQSSSNALDWVDEVVWLPADNPPERVCLNHLHGDTTYIAWTLRGDLGDVLTWAIDDVFVHAALKARLLLAPDGSQIVQWNAIGGSTGYVVRATETLRDAPWTTVATPGGTAWTNDTPDAAARFFKLEALLDIEEL